MASRRASKYTWQWRHLFVGRIWRDNNIAAREYGLDEIQKAPFVWDYQNFRPTTCHDANGLMCAVHTVLRPESRGGQIRGRLTARATIQPSRTLAPSAATREIGRGRYPDHASGPMSSPCVYASSRRVAVHRANSGGRRQHWRRHFHSGVWPFRVLRVTNPPSVYRRDHW